MHTVRPGVWQENRKMCKMRHKHCSTWNTARNTQKRGKGEMQHGGLRVW